jgi:competence protein ComGF
MMYDEKVAVLSDLFRKYCMVTVHTDKDQIETGQEFVQQMRLELDRVTEDEKQL